LDENQNNILEGLLTF